MDPAGVHPGVVAPRGKGVGLFPAGVEAGGAGQALLLLVAEVPPELLSEAAASAVSLQALMAPTSTLTTPLRLTSLGKPGLIVRGQVMTWTAFEDIAPDYSMFQLLEHMQDV